ncbi:hypothetical protein V2J09_020276, partial [Rumex salicifolius]
KPKNSFIEVLRAATTAASATADQIKGSRRPSYALKLISDIPMAQFIINYNGLLPSSQKFIIRVLDGTHLFVQPHAGEMIKSAIASFRDQNTYEKPP